MDAKLLLYMHAEWGWCEEYVPGCACCEGWKLFNATGKPPSPEAVYVVCEAINSQE